MSSVTSFDILKCCMDFRIKTRTPLNSVHLECSTKRKFYLIYFRVVVTDAFVSPETSKATESEMSQTYLGLC